MAGVSTDYYDDIQDLRALINLHSSRAKAQIDRSAAQATQVELNQTVYRATVLVRDLNAAVRDHTSLRNEIQGMRRALEMLDMNENSESIERLKDRIQGKQMSLRKLELAIHDLSGRLKAARLQTKGTKVALIDHLETCLAEAEAAEIRIQLGDRYEAVMRLREQVSEQAPMWSPTPVIGYRLWAVTGDEVNGVWKPWTSRTFEAECEKGDGVPHTDGRCARVAFGCGVYASKSILTLLRAEDAEKEWSFIAGAVSLLGTVVEHEHGYRAERAAVIAAVRCGEHSVWSFNDPDALDELFATPSALCDRTPPLTNVPEDDAWLHAFIYDELNRQLPEEDPWI